MNKIYTFIDLFAGCGGLSKGLEQAGFAPVFFNEIVPTYASTYLANHCFKEGEYYIGDINELNEKLDDYTDILFERPATLVCGGPPCQGFSMANRQRIIDDPRNQLYKAFLFFLSKVRPLFFIMENVKGMAKKFDEICDNFKEYLGGEYAFDYKLLKVQDFGVPQNRERFIMVGLKSARTASDTAYRNLVRRVNALWVVQYDEAYDDFINYVNEEIKHYKQEVLTRRKSKKPTPDDDDTKK